MPRGEGREREVCGARRKRSRVKRRDRARHATGCAVQDDARDAMRARAPCAAMQMVLPRFRAGMMSDSQYGSVRSIVSLRHSESGTSSSGMCA
jgi:hypothetical protein